MKNIKKYKQYNYTYKMKYVGERVFQKVPERIKILTFVSCYIVCTIPYNGAVLVVFFLLSNCNSNASLKRYMLNSFRFFFLSSLFKRNLG